MNAVIEFRQIALRSANNAVVQDQPTAEWPASTGIEVETVRAIWIERDIEQALVKDVTKLLLELGTGFAFLGNQYHLNVGGDDFYIDLLF